MIKMLQLLCYIIFMIKISCLRWKKKQKKNGETLAKHVTWQNHSVIATFRIIKGLKGKKNQELPPFGKFVIEVLIFRTTRSQMFFKIGVLKNLAVLKPLSNRVAGLLSQNTYGGCFWIFAAANTFLRWIWYLLLTTAPVFVPHSFENTSWT